MDTSQPGRASPQETLSVLPDPPLGCVSSPPVCSSDAMLTPIKHLSHGMMYTYAFAHTIEFSEGRNAVFFPTASYVFFRSQVRCHFFQEAILDFPPRWFKCLHGESLYHRIYCPMVCLYLHMSPSVVWKLLESIPESLFHSTNIY